MSDFAYVRKYYGVSPRYGQEVTVSGRRGVVIADRGHYVGVNFYDDKPGVVSNCHPTSEIEYGGQGLVRKPTPAQARYQRYLQSDGTWDSFLQFCRYDQARQKEIASGCGAW